MTAAREARFETTAGGVPSFNAREDVIKNFLGHVAVVVFSQTVPASDGVRGRAVIRNTGGLRSTGIEGLVKEGDEALGEAIDRLVAHRGFERALLALDFKRYEIQRLDQAFRADVELMGASEVITALPPMRHYIRLYPDQRDALLESFLAMEQALS